MIDSVCETLLPGRIDVLLLLCGWVCCPDTGSSSFFSLSNQAFSSAADLTGSKKSEDPGVLTRHEIYPQKSALLPICCDLESAFCTTESVVILNSMKPERVIVSGRELV